METVKVGMSSDWSEWQSIVILSPHITSVQYCGGCSALWGIASVHVGDSISTVESVQYCGGLASALQRDSISTAAG